MPDEQGDPYVYRSTLLPHWFDVPGDVAKAADVNVEVVEQTDDGYTIRTNGPLSGRLRAMFELDRIDNA